MGLDSKTAAKYAGVFAQMYLLRHVDVWAHNRLNRVVKTPKFKFIDADLLATLIELTAYEVERDRTRFGKVLESFAYGELLKATTTATGKHALMYYRDADKIEVDVVLERAAG